MSILVFLVLIVVFALVLIGFAFNIVAAVIRGVFELLIAIVRGLTGGFRR